jgi:hypothetical protein
MVCTPSGESSNREAVLSGSPQSNGSRLKRFREIGIADCEKRLIAGDAVNKRALTAARQWSGIFLSLRCRTRATRGEWPFFLAQSIASLF